MVIAPKKKQQQRNNIYVLTLTPVNRAVWKISERKKNPQKTSNNKFIRENLFFSSHLRSTHSFHSLFSATSFHEAHKCKPSWSSSEVFLFAHISRLSVAQQCCSYTHRSDNHYYWANHFSKLSALADVICTVSQLLCIQGTNKFRVVQKKRHWLNVCTAYIM